MDIHVVIQIATAIIASVGASGLIVVGLSSWLGKVWAARLMQKDVAKYATELEALKSKFEQSHRRLQSELDKTVFGHQLTTQNEFNGLSEIWKTIPPLERSMKYGRLFFQHLDVSPETKAQWRVERKDKFKHDLEAFETVIEVYAPFIPLGIYTNLTRMLIVAQEELFSTISSMRKELVAKDFEDGEVNVEAFWELRGKIFSAVSEKLKEISRTPTAI